MDQATKNTISKMQLAIWKLSEAKVLLDAIDGMDDYTDRINQSMEDLVQELDELSRQALFNLVWRANDASTI